MVTADIPAFKKEGSKLDRDRFLARRRQDLAGGVLIQTPCSARTAQVYAVAQGGLVIGGVFAGLMVPAAPPCRRIIQPWARSSRRAGGKGNPGHDRQRQSSGLLLREADLPPRRASPRPSMKISGQRPCAGFHHRAGADASGFASSPVEFNFAGRIIGSGRGHSGADHHQRGARAPLWPLPASVSPPARSRTAT